MQQCSRAAESLKRLISLGADTAKYFLFVSMQQHASVLTSNEIGMLLLTTVMS